jgi:outer membrane protein OmpA-like peptidoglycan-associated protein
MKKGDVFGLLYVLVLGLWMPAAGAEEYMKRGASVDDYEKALDRVMERKRGLVTGRERQPASASQSKPAPTQRPATVRTPAAQPSRTEPSRTQPARVASRGAAAAASAAVPDVYRPPASESDTADGVSLYFGYDSARLTETSMLELTKLGQALARPQFSDVTWLVEGHTDASGSDEYNQNLSEQRARSAERYLVERCGIDPTRLIPIGKGESDLYDREDPHASVNRRVRVRPVGD